MKRKLVSLLLSLSLMVVSVTGCQSDSVTEETKKEVQTKKSQVLSLYKEIETMIQKNHIEADADFIIHDGLIDDGGQFFKGPPDFSPLAGHGL